SDIGEALEARFVLEDKLIMLVFDAMHDGARVKRPA
ncbi:Regulator of sigma D, partial [Salmonella enterica subsp. enterica serovar Gaminara str. A4-567]